MRVVFMGTPQLAVPVLKSIIESRHEVVLVVTQPDKPAGRQRKLTAPPVKELAQSYGIPVMQPTTLRDESFRATIEEIKPDIGVVFAYGKILPQWLLDLPPHGMINIHASLLPRWRGAAPIQRAIIAGDKVTGITIQQMVAALDAGDILLQQEVEVEPEDNAETIAARMVEEAASLVIAALDGIEEGAITPLKQDETEVTYADKITEEDTTINWSRTAETIANQIRGLNPKPGVYTNFEGMILKVWKARPAPEVANGEPGTIVRVDKNEGVYVATGDIPLHLVEVQPANKKRMTGAEFARGYRVNVGDTLG